MTTEQIFMPKLGLHMIEGEVSAWLLDDEAECEKGAIVVEIETEKVTHEIEAPRAGRLRIIVPVGTVVEVGTVLGEIVGESAGEPNEEE
jgi:pyruvate/2-oxoglutarate dehydrogenase complex dihydrolipoamide acyltransferase (E2) component